MIRILDIQICLDLVINSKLQNELQICHLSVKNLTQISFIYKYNVLFTNILNTYIETEHSEVASGKNVSKYFPKEFQ